MKFHRAFVLYVAVGILPALTFFLVVPVIRDRLTIDAFAAFTVIVSVIGLLSVLDGGLGRTVTYLVSSNKKYVSRDTSILVASGLVVSLVGALLVIIVGLLLLDFQDGQSFVTARDALHVLLFFFPAFIAGSIFKGLFEGQQRFLSSAFLQLLQGVLIGLVPLFVLDEVSDLTKYAFGIGMIRVMTLVTYMTLTSLQLNNMFDLLVEMKPRIIEVFNYCKWLFVSNIVGLVIIFADRFTAAAVLSSELVAAYIVPMEIIARAQVLVGAFTTVFFPKLVVRLSENKAGNVTALIGNLQVGIVAAILGLGFLCIPFMHPIMEFLLGDTLASESVKVILVGFVGLALISSSSFTMLAINSLGHTKRVGILHAVEMPIYLTALYIASICGSIDFLLLAWLMRLVIDAVGLEYIFQTLRKPQHDKISKMLQFKRWLLLIGLLLAFGFTLIFDFNQRYPCLILAAFGSMFSIAISFIYIRLLQPEIVRWRNIKSIAQ